MQDLSVRLWSKIEQGSGAITSQLGGWFEPKSELASYLELAWDYSFLLWLIPAFFVYSLVSAFWSGFSTDIKEGGTRLTRDRFFEMIHSRED